MGSVKFVHGDHSSDITEESARWLHGRLLAQASQPDSLGHVRADSDAEARAALKVLGSIVNGTDSELEEDERRAVVGLLDDAFETSGQCVPDGSEAELGRLQMHLREP
jgi:hypothetical protein